MPRFSRRVSAALVLTGLLLPAPSLGAQEHAYDRDLKMPSPLAALQDTEILEGLEGRSILEMETRGMQRQADEAIFTRAEGMAAALLRKPLSWRSWVGHPLSITRRPQKGGDRFQFQLGLYRIGKKEYQKSAEAFLDLLTRFPDSPLRVEALYGLAESHYRSGNWAEAEKAFQILLRERPAGKVQATVLATLGWIAQRGGRLGDALDYYRQVLDEHPGSPSVPPVVFRTGEVLYRQQKPAAAAEQFMRASREMDSQEGRDRALFWWAESLLAAGEFARSRTQFELFREGGEGGPLDDRALYGIGWCFLKEGNYDRAGEVFLELVETHPESHLSDESLLLAGWSYLKGGRGEESLAVFRQLAARYPASPWIGRGKLLLGMVLYEGDRFQEAFELFESLAGESVESSEALFMSGMSLAGLERYGDAFLRFARLVEKDGREAVPTAQVRAAWTAFRTGNLREAETRFMAALRFPHTREEVSEIWYWLGEVALAAGRMEQAALYFARSVEAAPEGSRTTGALFHIGEIHDNQERWGDAVDTYRRLVDHLAGSDARGEALLKLARSLSMDGREREAVELLQDTLQGVPAEEGGDRARYGLGSVYLRNGEKEKALREFDSIVKEYPGSELADDAWFQIGWGLYLEGRFAEAAEEFGEIVRRYPHGDMAPQAQLRKADSLYRLRMLPEALEAYRDLSRIFPGGPHAEDAEYGIAMATLAKGDFDEYAAMSRSFAGRHPESPLTPAVLSRLGRQLLLRQQYREADEVFLWLLREHPGEDSASFALLQSARAERREESRREAGYRLRDGLDGGPGPDMAAVYLFGLANLSLEEGDCEGALVEYRRILQEDARHPLAPYAMFDSAGCHLHLNRPDEARSAYRRIAEEYTEWALLPGVLYRLGSLDLERGAYAEAVDTLKRVPDGIGGYLEARTAFKLGRALENLGRSDDAYGEYLRALELAPGGDFSRMAALRGAEIAVAGGRTDEAAALYRTVLERGAEDVLAELAREGLAKTDGNGTGGARKGAAP